MKRNNQAFTLIELLVVVLIIGILAAVAVPQYQVAVVKSRVGTMLPLMASMAQAEESYYLANGQYTDDISALDVEIPKECSEIENPIEDGVTFACGKYFTLYARTNGMVNLNYCPENSQNLQDCLDNRTVHISFRLQHYRNSSQVGEIRCSVYNDSKLAKAVCSSLGLMNS